MEGRIFFFKINKRDFTYIREMRVFTFSWNEHIKIALNEQPLFLKVDQSQPQPNCKTKPFWVQGIWLVSHGHTLADFAIGDLHLATIATLHLRVLHRIKKKILKTDFYFLLTWAQKNIYYDLVSMATLLDGI